MKLLSLLLVLLLCSCGASCAETPEDPVLVAVNDMLPVDVLEFVLVDDELLLLDVRLEKSKRRELMNLSTGERIPLTLEEGYVPHRFYSKNPEAVLLTEMTQQDPSYYLGNEQFFWMGNPAVSFVVDKTTGVAKSGSSRASSGWELSGVTPWGELFTWIRDMEVEVYKMDARQGYLFDKKDAAGICGVYPLPDGFLIFTGHEHVELETESYGLKRSTRRGRFTFTDRQLNTERVIELGGVPYTDRLFSCWRAPDTGTILLSTDGMIGALLITPDRNLYALIGQDDELRLVPYEDTTEIADGLWEARIIHLCGISDDGSYAFVTRIDRGLYMIDLKTREITQQMTAEELTALGLHKNLRLFWPGGEYLYDHDGNLLRIVDRSELSQ